MLGFGNGPSGDRVTPVLAEVCKSPSPVRVPKRPFVETLIRSNAIIPVGTKPIFIELCAGSAGLSLYVNAEGFRSIPVDHSRCDHKSKVPCVILDLSDPAQAQIIINLLRSGNVAAIHAGVPCGTASRAREIALPGGRKGPPQLRSKEFPWGIPGIGPIDQLKVDKANLIYKNVATILDVAIELGILVSIENPKNSYLWDLPWYSNLLSRGFFDVVFQHCRWNPNDMPSRAKWTRIRTNCNQLLNLAGPCTQLHQHLAWGQNPDGTFATKNEAEYNDGMCKEMASSFAAAVTSKGCRLVPSTTNADITATAPHKRRRGVMGRQPRGKAIPAVISEFGSIATIPTADILQDAKHYKVLRQIGAEKGDTGTQDTQESTVVGIFRDPNQFLEAAKQAIHPADCQGAIPDLISRAIVKMFESSPQVFVRNMLLGIKELTKIIQDNKADDSKLLAQAHPHCAKILAGKKFKTMADLIAKFNYPDKLLPQDTRDGFSISGMQPFSGVFDHDVRLPLTTVESLRLNSRVSNEAILSRVKSAGCGSVDRKAWEISLGERDAGWLLGPVYSCDELANLIGTYPHLARRFPLTQGEKLRPIDDLTEPGTNSSFGTQDKICFQDADTMSAVVRLIERILADGLDCIELIDGSSLRFTVHRDWVTIPLCKDWRGKNFDLSKAYKQLAVAPSEWWASSIAQHDPVSGRTAMFGQVTLPFGASGAVLAFNRSSTFLWASGIQLLGVIWTSFYDDFPVFAPAMVAESVRMGIELFFRLLGWKLALEPEKSFDFAASFASLGIVFNVSRMVLKDASVQNKPTRISSVTEQLRGIQQSGVFPHILAESVQGKVQFMESSIFGRAGRCVASLFNRSNRASQVLTAKDNDLIDWLCTWLLSARPRQISPKFLGPPILLFSDGACEYLGSERLVTCGALLYDPRDGALLFFGFRVNQYLEAEWARSGRRQLVTEAELLPQLIARRLWSNRLANAKVISFLDSEPSKFCCIKGFSDSECCEDIVRAIQTEEQSLMPWTWYSRVPTFSNPSDAASRLDFALMMKQFPQATLVDAEAFQPLTLRKGFWARDTEG